MACLHAEGDDHRRESGSAGGMAARERVEAGFEEWPPSRSSMDIPSRTPNIDRHARAPGAATG